MEYIDISKGRLDAKLVVTNENGDETWLPFDTRTATQEPDGKIMVFYSDVGIYKQANNLQHAKEMFEELYEMWKMPAPKSKSKSYSLRGKLVVDEISTIEEKQ